MGRRRAGSFARRRVLDGPRGATRGVVRTPPRAGWVAGRDARGRSHAAACWIGRKGDPPGRPYRERAGSVVGRDARGRSHAAACWMGRGARRAGSFARRRVPDGSWGATRGVVRTRERDGSIGGATRGVVRTPPRAGSVGRATHRVAPTGNVPDRSRGATRGVVRTREGDGSIGGATRGVAVPWERAAWAAWAPWAEWR